MDDATKPIADWLRATRLRQTMPGTEEAWTQDYFLERLAEPPTNWTLARSNYSKYETGKQTPRGPTLRRFVSFWAAHGEAGPPPAAPEQEDSAVEVTESGLVAAAIDRQTDAIREQTAAANRQTAMLRAVLEAITGVTPPVVEEDVSPGQSTRLRELVAGADASVRT